MSPNLNPGEKTAAESDYEKKFNRHNGNPATAGKDLKAQEAAGDNGWKTSASKKNDNPNSKKGVFGFKGRHAGKLRKGSAFTFIIAMLGVGVWYTSVLAPNILLVNIKEMYTNDLADATTALEIYTQVMYFNKLGPMAGQDCNGEQDMSMQPIKCKLTTMSRSQLNAFERQGFSFGIPIPDSIRMLIPSGGDIKFCAQKVYEDNRDDGDAKNDKPESRYKVFCILPPNYKQVINSVQASGTSSIMKALQGDSDPSSGLTAILDQFKIPVGDAKSMLTGILANAPITSGPQLWLYSQLSSTTKQQVFGVFNPKSSFFADERYKQRIKTRYNMTKNVTVSSNPQSSYNDQVTQVNNSFDNAVQKVDSGIDSYTGQPNPTDGVSAASLSSPFSLTQLKGIAGQLQSGINLDTLSKLTSELPFVADIEIAGNLLATNTYSYTDLMCSWYTIGKLSNNALVRAKASTAARYALQYLKAADAIKAGTADEVPTNVLASKLAQHSLGDYGGGSATDSLIYRSITFGDSFPNTPQELTSLISDPSKAFNLATDALAIVIYNLSAYETAATLAPAWMATVTPNSGALGAVTGAQGMLVQPPGDALGIDRKYCLSGETTENKTEIKGTNTQDTLCKEAIPAMGPASMQAALAGAIEIGRRSCPPVNAYDDNIFQAYLGNWRGPVSNTILPSQKIVQATMTPYVAGWFGISSMLASAVTQQLYTSSVKGITANYALFSGMGELLGDMAMSRGLMPSNMLDMEAYLHLGEVIGVQKDQDDIARANARQNPFDPYNKFSFAGAALRSLSPSVESNSPLYSTLSNVLSLIGSSAVRIGQTSSANAFYNSQPSLLTTSPAETAEREASYAARLSGAFCPIDLEYFAIGIQPDIMCNVRYSMPVDDMAKVLNLGDVVDHMTGNDNSKVYQSQLDELDKRIGEADIEGNKEYLTLQRSIVSGVQGQPFIDKNTGKPTPNSEYDKYLTYCVNRLDPWGRSAVGIRYNELSNDEKAKRTAAKTPDGGATSRNDPGDPNQKYAAGLPAVGVTDALSKLPDYVSQISNFPAMAVTATQSDYDWYTGKKCTRAILTAQGGQDIYNMVQYFRVFYTMCSVDGSMSGTVDCTEPDHGNNYTDPFYLNNDILYTSWY